MSRRWILPAVLLVLFFTAGLINVEPGTVGVLQSAGGGRSFILGPGLHFRVPFIQRLALYPAGIFRFDFTAKGVSREGSAVELQAHFEGGILREALIEFSRRAVGRNAPTMVRDDLAPRLTAWAAERSLSAIPTAPLEVGDRVRADARALGYQIKSLTVSRVSATPSGSSGIPPGSGSDSIRIALIGLDGADWQIIDPLIAAGKLPALAKLKRTGAWANLRSMDPMLSPLLWTTAATGRPPEEHGVIDFMVPDPSTGGRVPVGSAARKTKAIWNIFNDAGKTSNVVAWWATWPAESIQGTMVSDRVAYSLFAAGGGPELKGAVYPDSYGETVGRLQVPAEAITAADLGEFVDVPAAEIDAARRRARSDPKFEARDPVLHLARILAGTRTYQALTLDLLGRGQGDLLAVYYQGIDEVSHRFAHYADPKMDLVSDADHRRFRRAVEAFYRYQDRLLGELLSRLDPSTLVVVLSDHGFRNGAGRPKDQPPDIEGQPARWHRPYGIFLAAGPMVAPGEKETVSLLEVLPTLLAAAGLPAADDLPGTVRRDLFGGEFAARLPTRRIPTYETGSPRRAAAVPEDATSREAAAALEENLRSLGYIGGGGTRPEGKGETAFSHANLAGIHLQKGRLDEAESEARKALAIAPGYYPALVYLSQVYERQGRPAEALPLARQAAVTSSPDRQSGIYLLLANLYVALGKNAEGLRELSGFAARENRVSDLHSAMGILKEAGKDEVGAEAEYRLALELDPAAAEPVKRLFDLYRRRGQLDRLVPVLRAVLEGNPESVFHHNYLGMILDQQGRPADAEREYRTALKADPDHAGVLVNLGALLARQRRLDEAATAYRRALSREPRSPEARVGLGAVLGIQGKTDEAIQLLEEGSKLGIASPSLFNALALAYDQNRQRSQAISALKESLRLNPGQPETRALLAQWEKR